MMKQMCSEYIISILCMFSVVCLGCIILSWWISTTGQTTDLTDTRLVK